MKRAKVGVALGLGGLAALAAAWWGRTPRLETAVTGGATPLGISVGRDVPPTFGAWPALSTPGFSPTRIHVRLPALPRDVMGAQATFWREPDVPPRLDGRPTVAARLRLPNGSTAPLDVQRDGDRAIVDLRGDVPPGLDHAEVEVFVPGARTTRLRVRNLPTGVTTFDVGRRITAQGPARGEAWWQPQGPGCPSPALFARLRAEGFAPRAGERCEMSYDLIAPFAERGHDPLTKAGGSFRVGAGTSVEGMWMQTPHAAYAKALRAKGALRRYRVFDETIDLGTALLRPRQSGAMAMDAAPVLKGPRTATTRGGLRLTIPVRSLQDHNQFALGSQSVSLWMDVDRATVAKGLPTDMATRARTKPVEVQVRPVGRADREWFVSVDDDPRLRDPKVHRVPEYVLLSDVAPRRLDTFPLRFVVRRRVLVEEIPFDLTLPVGRPTKPVAVRRGMSDGGFE